MFDLSGQQVLLRIVSMLVIVATHGAFVAWLAVLMGDRVVVLKGRPSGVHETVVVDLPRPRGRSTLLHPRFVALREHVWDTLMKEAREAEFNV